MAIHIGKYAFNSKEQAIDKIEALGVEQDEEGNHTQHIITQS